MQSHYILCTKCKTQNTNTDYCVNCNELINYTLKRKLETEQKLETIKQINSERKPNKVMLKLEKLKKHNNILVRLFAYIIYSIGFIAVAIATGIAALVAGIAAG